MKEFNLEEAKAGKPVCTREGTHVDLSIIGEYVRDDEPPKCIGSYRKEIVKDYGDWRHTKTICGASMWNIDGSYISSSQPHKEDLMMEE